jgi:hypothetical protein
MKANLSGSTLNSQQKTEEKIFIDLEKHELAISATETGSNKKVQKSDRIANQRQVGEDEFKRGILDLNREKISSV